MIDPAALLAGAGILSTGLMAGWVTNSMFRRAKQTPRTYKCTCMHPFSSHDPKTGMCHDKTHQGGVGNTRARWVDCPCRRFTGRRPPPELDEILRGVGGTNNDG